MNEQDLAAIAGRAEIIALLMPAGRGTEHLLQIVEQDVPALIAEVHRLQRVVAEVKRAIVAAEQAQP